MLIALVMPWVPVLHTTDAASPGKLLTAGMAATQRLWIKIGGGPVALGKPFSTH